jgi:apolipoprotein N-acyltransferase
MLLTLSFAPLGWWPLAFFMPAVLMWLWQGASPRRAAVLGFWFSAGTFAVGTYWMYISIRIVAQAPIPLALLLMAGLVSIMGAYQALSGWLVAKYLPARGAWRWLVGIPALWLLGEWWRGWFLTGFGWFALGYSQTDTWLSSLSPVIGQYGLGFLILLIAGALMTLLDGGSRERIAAGIVIVVVWGLGFALRGVEWTQPYSRPISVAVVQGAIPQDEKWIAENLQSTLDRYQELTRQAHGARIIV